MHARALIDDRADEPLGLSEVDGLDQVRVGPIDVVLEHAEGTQHRAFHRGTARRRRWELGQQARRGAIIVLGQRQPREQHPRVDPILVEIGHQRCCLGGLEAPRLGDRLGRQHVAERGVGLGIAEARLGERRSGEGLIAARPRQPGLLEDDRALRSGRAERFAPNRRP